MLTLGLGCLVAACASTSGDYAEAAKAVLYTAAARRAGACFSKCAPGLICQASTGYCCDPKDPGCRDYPAELAQLDGGTGPFAH